MREKGIVMSTVVRVMGSLMLGLALSAPMTPAAAGDRYGPAELDRLLAPIALYPDSVLSHVLIAATYPLEVVQAARWSRAHPELSGEDAVDTVEDEDWDPSVKALVAFPEVLARMDEDLDWTEQLGAAFLAQEGDVMDRVQVLRTHAYEAGRLDSLEHVRVIREREYIYIEPAVRHLVFVPYYDPWYVYGSWWWPEYPPYCWRTWGGHAVGYYRPGFHWGVGFRLAPTFYFTSFHWPARYVVVTHDYRRSRPIYSGRDVPRHESDVRRWRHDERRYAPAQRQERRRAQPAPGTRAQPAQREERRQSSGERPRSQPPRNRTAPESRERAPREEGRREPAARAASAETRANNARAAREHTGRPTPRRADATGQGRERSEAGERRPRENRGQQPGRGEEPRQERGQPRGRSEAQTRARGREQDRGEGRRETHGYGHNPARETRQR